MGVSYQTLLVVAELPTVVEQLTKAAITGVAHCAGPGRTAVIPRNDETGYVDTERMGAWVSRSFGHRTLSNMMIDSDVVVLSAFDGGRQTHRYVSDQAMLVDWFVNDEGQGRFRIDDVEQPEDAVPPSGPLGADPDAFVPFGTGEIERDRLRAVLEGDVDRTLRAALVGRDAAWVRRAVDATPIWAELQHRLILETLNLDHRGLMDRPRDLYGVDGAVPF